MPRVIEWLKTSTNCFVLSHSCIAAEKSCIKVKIEKMRRYSYGWSSSFTENELVKMFNGHGYRLKEKEKWRTVDGDEDIFLFQKIT